jgi:hypothetical protein
MKSRQRKASRHLWPSMETRPPPPKRLAPKDNGNAPPRQPPPWPKAIDIARPEPRQLTEGEAKNDWQMD